MAIIFHRGLAIPLWAVAFGAIALSTPPPVMPSLTVLLGIAVIAVALPAIVRWRRASRPPVEVLPAVDQDPGGAAIIVNASTCTRSLAEVIDARIVKGDDAADLVRMDDDGGWQMGTTARS
jgi:hypothetical protein